MFDADPSARRRDRPPGGLAALRERARPVSARRTQLLPVAAPLADLVPGGGLQRGSTVGITAGAAGGSTTLALALVAAASAAGSWCVAVGLPDLGGLAAHELTVDLGRLALVPRPGGHWAATVAMLVEEVDVVLLRPPPTVAGHRARQLAARLRHRRGALVLVDAGRWPERCDVDLRVGDARWVGVGRGEDRLRRRQATVTATARRGDGRPRRARLWLPGPGGAVVLADPGADPSEPADPSGWAGPGGPA